MKRSEMLEILSQAIYDFKEFDSVNADKVLTCIEKAGMLPPNNGTYSTRRHSGDELLYVSEVYDWEPEDE